MSLPATRESGPLNVVDAERDPLSFTVTKAPIYGTVVINPDGTFAYTPSPQLAAGGGADEFVADVVDQGFHLHGLLAVFKNNLGHTQPGNNVGISVGAVLKNTVVDTIDVGDVPVAVAVSPDSDTVYVANFDDDTVSVIDTSTGNVVATILSTAPLEEWR